VQFRRVPLTLGMDFNLLTEAFVVVVWVGSALSSRAFAAAR